MSSGLIFFPILALALGVKHAYDGDHLVAVSNFLTRSKGVRDTFRMTFSWAIGHTVTAAIITTFLFSLATQAESITVLLSRSELAVAIMLIVIGAAGILLEVPTVHDYYHRHIGGRLHSHTHRHRFGRLGGFASKTHLRHPLLGVGIIHGLASNDELFVLFVAGLGVGSLELLLGGLSIYAIGVVLGMSVFGIAITRHLHKYGVKKLRLATHLVAGSLSILYGLWILAGLSGFNPLDFLIV